MVANRASWRVDSDSATSNSKSKEPVGKGVGDDAGEIGKTVVFGTIVGKVVGDSGDGELAGGGAGIPVGSPWAARALTTASQPFSSVLIRSRSSSFSLSRALSRSRSSSAER